MFFEGCLFLCLPIYPHVSHTFFITLSFLRFDSFPTVCVCVCVCVSCLEDVNQIERAFARVRDREGEASQHLLRTVLRL